MEALRRRLAVQDPEQGSMLLVLFAIMVVGSLTIISVVTAVKAQQSTRHDEGFTQALPFADQNVERAQLLLNTGQAAQLPSTPTGLDPATGCPTASSPTQWYAVKQSSLAWKVWSRQTVAAVARCVHATIQQSPRFPLAAFADTAVQFRGDNAANSYNHYTGGRTADGFVGSNNSVTFNGNATADGVQLYDWAADPNAGRCSGSICGTSSTTTVNGALDISSNASQVFIRDALYGAAGLNCGGACLPAYVSSATSRTLPAGIQCYSSMTFDSTTTVLGTTGANCDPTAADYNPTKVYVLGNVSIGNHLNINYTTSTPNACNLQIYSLGSSFAIGNHSNVAGVLYAPNADCSGNPSNAQSDIYGSAFCKSIGNQGGWSFHYDDALAGIGNGQWDRAHFGDN